MLHQDLILDIKWKNKLFCFIVILCYHCIYASRAIEWDKLLFTNHTFLLTPYTSIIYKSHFSSHRFRWLNIGYHMHLISSVANIHLYSGPLLIISPVTETLHYCHMYLIRKIFPLDSLMMMSWPGNVLHNIGISLGESLSHWLVHLTKGQ